MFNFAAKIRYFLETAKKTTRNLQVINEFALKSVIYTPIIAPHIVFTFPQVIISLK